MATFSTRALRHRRLAWAMIGEPVDSEIDQFRQNYRKMLAGKIEARIRAAIEGKHLPEQNAALAAAAVVGAMLEGLIGPLAPEAADDPARIRDTVQALILFALRGLGVVDARARGLVVQAKLPADSD
jgi:hypothetical protein